MKSILILVLSTQALVAEDTVYRKHEEACLTQSYCDGLLPDTMIISYGGDVIKSIKFIAESELSINFPKGKNIDVCEDYSSNVLVDESTGHSLPSQHY